MSAEFQALPLRVVIAALVAGCALGLMHLVCVIGLHVPFDPNEGWNATFAQAAMATGSPYPPPHGLLINNYPPLSFYLVGTLAKLTGDAIVTGRVVSLASLFAIALGIDTAVRQMGCNRIESLFASLLFVAGLMLTTNYVGMDDPQLLGHAIAIGGLVLVLREPRKPRLMVGAALLFTLALLIKHNLIVLPAALALWLLLADRRHATTFIASGLIFFLIGLGLFRQAFGISLFSQIDSARLYALENVGTGLSIWLQWAAAPLVGAALLLAIARRDRHAVLCVSYAATAIAAGAVFLGGAGVDANALFDADIALSLCAGVVLNRLEHRAWSGAAALLYAVPLAIGLWNLDADWRNPDFWLHPMAEDRRAAAGEIALIRSSRGPAVCEMQSLCIWAGKPAEVDVFNVEQEFLTGARSDAGLTGLIDKRHYALIQLEQLTPFPLTPNTRRAIERNYRIVRSDEERVFFEPR